MKRRALVLGALFALFILSLGLLEHSPTTVIAQGAKPPAVPNEVLVEFQPGVSAADIVAFYAEHRMVEKKKLGSKLESFSNPRLAKVNSARTMGDSDEFIRTLENDLRVKYAEPNYIVSIALEPNDLDYPQLWGLGKVDAPQAWDITTGSSDVIVVVIDTGVDYTHEDLVGNIWTNPGEISGDGIDNDNNGYIDDIHGWNVIANTGDPMDDSDSDHGTHVAGIVGAQGNNGTGVVGVNWDVSIAACKFLGSNGIGTIADATECFNYSNALKQAGHNVLITNNSWGGGGFTQTLKDAMTSDILHIAAAGNFNNNNDANPLYPSSYDLPNIIAVASTDSNDNYASNSSYGATSVDLAAPGVSILSTTRNSGYGLLSGTSMASPHVAGAAALIWAIPANSGLAAANVKQHILSGVDSLDNLSKQTFTNGRLSVFNSVANASTPTVTLLLPDNGSTAGGASVVIGGNYLSGATQVAFGGVVAPSFIVDSDNQITAVSPAHAAGTADVLVTTPSGISANTVADDYTYNLPVNAPPSVTILSPNAGNDWTTSVSSVDVGGDALDSDGNLAQINLSNTKTGYADQILGSGFALSFNFASAPLQVGTNTITVTAVDAGGAATADTIIITRIPDPSLLGYWKLDEGSGVTTQDSSGKGNTGTLIGGTLWIDGKIGKALQFDGVNDAWIIPSNDLLNFEAGEDFTISLWFKDGTNQNDAEIIEKQQGGVFYQIRSPNRSGGNLKFQIDDGVNQDSFVSQVGNLADDVWHHIVFIRDYDTEIRAYVDNVFAGSDTTVSSGSIANSADLRFGGGNSGQYDGMIDQVNFFGRALLTEEITALYAQGGVEPILEITPTVETDPVLNADDAAI